MPQSPTATLALLLVFPATILAFSLFRPAKATAWIMIGCMLFLPELAAFKLPVIRDIGKWGTVTFCCIVAQLVVAAREHRAAKLMRGREWAVLLCFPASAILTTINNLDGANAMVLTDVPAAIVGSLLYPSGAFLLTRMVFRTAEDGLLLLKGLVAGAIAYLPFIAIELKSGPVVHPAIYGYLQHDLGQTMRGGGFRPMVFMSHGLALALFMACATMAALILSRQGKNRVLGLPAPLIAIGLLVLFPILKSNAALVYTLIATTVIVLLKPRAQATFALSLAILQCVFMALRILGLIDIWAVTSFLGKFVPDDRLGSLGYRFFNEDILIAHALLRPMFGWGGNGRFLPPGGAVCDGAWVIALGHSGIVGLVLSFGLLALPIIVAHRRIRRAGPAAQPILSGLSVMLALSTFDLIPNGMFNYLQLMLAGGLLGLAWGIPDEKKKNWLPLLAAWYARRRRAPT